MKNFIFTLLLVVILYGCSTGLPTMKSEVTPESKQNIQTSSTVSGVIISNSTQVSDLDKEIMELGGIPGFNATEHIQPIRITMTGKKDEKSTSTRELSMSEIDSSNIAVIITNKDGINNLTKKDEDRIRNSMKLSLLKKQITSDEYKALEKQLFDIYKVAEPSSESKRLLKIKELIIKMPAGAEKELRLQFVEKELLKLQQEYLKSSEYINYIDSQKPKINAIEESMKKYYSEEIINLEYEMQANK